MERHAGQLVRVGLALAVAVGLAMPARADDKAKDGPSGKILVAALKNVGDNAPKVEYWMLELDPKSGGWREVMRGDGGFLRPTPGGKWFVNRGRDGTVLLDPRGKAKPIKILEDAALAPVAWSPDGRHFLATKSLIPRARTPREQRFETWRFHVDGSNPVRLDIPETDQVADWSPDGRWLLTTSNRDPAEGRQIYRMHPDGTGQLRLTREGHYRAPRSSPDGRAILVHRDTTERTNASAVWLMGADGSKPRAAYDVEGDATQACWSPDGKRLAVRVVDLRRNPDGTIAPGVPAEGGHPRIEVMDLDGDHRESFSFPVGFFYGNPEWVAGD